jgi:Flp pilus assembly protein TadD
VKLVPAAVAATLLLAACVDPAPDPKALGTAAWRAGYAALQAKDYAAAESRLLEAQRDLPDDAYVALDLGVAEQNLGKVVAARAAYERAIALGGQRMPRDVTDPRYGGMTVAQLAKADLDAMPK